MVFPSTRSESYTVDNHRNPLFTERCGTDVARNGHAGGYSGHGRSSDFDDALFIYPGFDDFSGLSDSTA